MTNVAFSPWKGAVSAKTQANVAGEMRAILAALRAQTRGDVDPRSLKQLCRARRARNHFFPEGLFADPAWDILLDLFAAEVGQQRVTVSSACIAAAVPGTTALRYLEILSGHGLISRESDPLDRRRKFISLTPAASEALRSYFNSIPDEVAPI